MSPALLIHTIAVQRQVGTVLSGSRQESWQTVVQALKCRVEPMSGRDKQTILGHVSIDAYRLSWGLEDVRAGDRFDWKGKTFAVISQQDDRDRPTHRYQTATCTEAKIR
jgi:hypothetical protein